MHRRLRIDVAEGKHVVVLEDDIGRNLAADDLAEQVSPMMFSASR